jgi:hypothetical protein
MDKSGKVSESLASFVLDLKLRNQADLAEQKLRQSANKIDASTAQNIYLSLIKVERCESQLRGVLMVHLLSVAFMLQKEGVISCPSLEWDGDLGPEEQKVIGRLGFLLNAYSVQTWWWELLEMARKFVLTAGLPVFFRGSPVQMGLSLVLIFLYLMAHILMKPMLNQGLNIFQQLSFISQFFTVYGALMLIVKEYMDMTTPPHQDGTAKMMIPGIVYFFNLAAIAVFPVYRAYNAWCEKGEIDQKMLLEMYEKYLKKYIPKWLQAYMLKAYVLYKHGKTAAEFQNFVPVIEKLNENDVKGALALVMTVPVLKLLVKIKPEMARTVLEKVLLNPAVKTGIDRATAAAPKEHRGPFEEMQAFLGSLPSLDSDELIDGVGRVSNAFKQVGEASTNFKFPEDLVASIANPIAILEQLSTVIPAPFDTPYIQALRLAQQLAEFAVLVPLIDKVKAGDLKGALGIAVSGPVMLLVAKLAGNEDFPAEVLRKILGSDAFKTSMSSTLRVMPDGQKSPFQALLDLRLELPLPELVSELDKALKGFQAPAFKAMEMKFPDDLLENIDHIGILKELGALMPEPLDEMYARAMELAEFAAVLPMIDKLKNGDVKGALALVMTVPVLKLLVKIKPEMARTVLEKVLLNPAVKTGNDHIDQAMTTVLETFLSSVQSVDQMQLVANLERVSNAFEQVGEASTNFKFPEDLVKGVENPIAILEELDSIIPPPLASAYQQALWQAKELTMSHIIPGMDMGELDLLRSVVISDDYLQAQNERTRMMGCTSVAEMHSVLLPGQLDHQGSGSDLLSPRARTTVHRGWFQEAGGLKSPAPPIKIPAAPASPAGDEENEDSS